MLVEHADCKVGVQRLNRAEICAIFVVAFRSTVHRGGQHLMLAIHSSISQDAVDVPSIVSIYYRPGCTLLSHQTACISCEVVICHSSGEYRTHNVENVPVERTYFGGGVVLASVRH